MGACIDIYITGWMDWWMNGNIGWKGVWIYTCMYRWWCRNRRMNGKIGWADGWMSWTTDERGGLRDNWWMNGWMVVQSPTAFSPYKTRVCQGSGRCSGVDMIDWPWDMESVGYVLWLDLLLAKGPWNATQLGPPATVLKARVHWTRLVTNGNTSWDQQQIIKCSVSVIVSSEWMLFGSGIIRDDECVQSSGLRVQSQPYVLWSQLQKEREGKINQTC